MGFYDDVPVKKRDTSKYRTTKDYKKKSLNLDKNENLYEKFWELLRSKREFHKGQEEIFKAFFEDKYKYLFMRMGRKGAKTTSNIVIAWGYSLLTPRSTCYVTLPTITQAIDIYWDEKRLQYCDLAETSLFDGFVKSVDNNKHTITFINDSMIKLIGTWREASGRGTQPNLLVVDEIQDCSAEYLDAMEPNLAAKEDARCVMSGTPPKKKNHYHIWESRIRDNEQGYNLHYSSYINTALPHLKIWLDKKKEELFAAGKEDVWLREYMAEDCFSSDERILPDISLTDHNEIIAKLVSSDPTAFTPIIGILITEKSICATYSVSLKSRSEGTQFWVLKTEIVSRLWDKSYQQIYSDLQKTMNEISQTFTRPWRKVVYDETKSFIDVVSDVTTARDDFKWQKRGIPLLKELTVNNKMNFSTHADQFAVEAQNVLKEDDINDFPTVCSLAMLANEYYQPPALSKEEKVVWDQFAPLREAGIICCQPKRNGKSWISYNWD